MTIIPIYSSLGVKVDELIINDNLTHVSGRVSKGDKGYYKGVGVPYHTHHIQGMISDEYEFIKHSDIFYLGEQVIKKCFKDKFGIFQERYQPFFPDFIGACSVKEGTIVLNSMGFEKSSVDVLDCINFDKVNDQYYYIVEYTCKRENYLKGGDPKKLRELIDFMITNDWNFLWDKAAINDISKYGTVSDVADVFKSDSFTHKLGTVYSVLYSLHQLNSTKYYEFLAANGLQHVNQMSIVLNSIIILRQNNVDVSHVFKHNNIYEDYKDIVLTYLINGKNCAYCACDLYMNNGEAVRKEYVRRITESFERR